MLLKKILHKIIRFTVLVIGRIGFVLYPFSLAERIKLFKTKIYTNWSTTKFKYVGEKTTLIYPITIQGDKYISIGKEVAVGARTIITAWDEYEEDKFTPQINIGNNVNIGEDCHITAINRIEIGDNVLMGKKITITDNSHGKTEYALLSIPPIKRPLYSKGPVIIGDGVWIGDKATILSGVRIGKNSIIAANAVITNDVPANCVVGGIPARIIKIME